MLQAQIEDIAEEFKHGNFVYIYYKFMDKFHTEPRDWQSLFEFLTYTQTEGKINECITKNAEVESGK